MDKDNEFLAALDKIVEIVLLLMKDVIKGPFKT